MRAGAGGLQCLLDVQRWVKQLQGVMAAFHSVLIVLAGGTKGRLCVPYLACGVCAGQV